jgi:hypothetical protein
MKKITLTVAALILLAASCKKTDTTTTTTPTTTTPTTTGPTAATPSFGNTSNLSGALISVEMKYTSQPTGSPIPIDLVSEIGTAVFYNPAGSGTSVDAGTVSVNTINLDKATNNSYSKLATTGLTPATLNLITGSPATSSWSIGGSSSVAAFTYDHVTAFPSFTGTMPASITKASGVSFTFNSSTVTGADSVIVVIAAGSSSFTKSYSKTAGTITISASDLSGFPTVSDNSATLEVCPYNVIEVTKNGKNYFAVKEQATVKNININ